MSTRTAAAILLVVMCPALASAQLGFGRSRPKTYQSPGQDVTFQYPGNWKEMAVAPPVVASLTKDDDVSFIVNRIPVQFPQEYSDAFAAIEVKLVQGNYPAATSMSHKPVKHPTLGTILQVDFALPAQRVGGRNVRAQQVRYYSIPVGRSVYRIAAAARADQFEKEHGPAFESLLVSMVITPLKANPQ